MGGVCGSAGPKSGRGQVEGWSLRRSLAGLYCSGPGSRERTARGYEGAQFPGSPESPTPGEIWVFQRAPRDASAKVGCGCSRGARGREAFPAGGAAAASPGHRESRVGRPRAGSGDWEAGWAHRSLSPPPHPRRSRYFCRSPAPGPHDGRGPQPQGAAAAWVPGRPSLAGRSLRRVPARPAEWGAEGLP